MKYILKIAVLAYFGNKEMESERGPGSLYKVIGSQDLHPMHLTSRPVSRPLDYPPSTVHTTRKTRLLGRGANPRSLSLFLYLQAAKDR